MPDDSSEAARGKPTDVQAAGYALREVAKTKAKSQQVVAGFQLTKDVLVQLIAVAKVHPLFGAILSLIVVDILAQNGVLSKQGSTLGYIMVGGAFGVSVADEVASDISSILTSLSPWKTGGPGAADPAALITPSPTTFVEASPAPPPSPWPLDDTMASLRRAQQRSLDSY